MKRETFYLSCDKRTKIHAVAWKPDSRKVKAVIQICHGMAEYIDRYEEFALWLAGKGYYVTGHDHMGHGKSILSEGDMAISRRNREMNVSLEIYENCIWQQGRDTRTVRIL